MLSQKLNSHIILKLLAKALIRLRVCAGWSAPLLVAHTTLLEISCRGSYDSTVYLFAYENFCNWSGRKLINCVLFPSLVTEVNSCDFAKRSNIIFAKFIWYRKDIKLDIALNYV